MANKMTIKDYFEEIIALAQENGRDDLVAFCEDRIEKASRKAGSKKPTKNQLANEDIKAKIVEVLGELDAPVTVSALLTDPRLDITSQKATSLLTQLVKAEEVVRTEDKGKAYYSVG